MQIKGLAHARELYEQGVLVPGKTLLKDRVGDENLFLGFSRSGNFITDDHNGMGSMVWSEGKIYCSRIAILKPKKKIKLECWVCFSKHGDVFATSDKEFAHDEELRKNLLHIEHICIDKEVEDEQVHRGLPVRSFDV